MDKELFNTKIKHSDTFTLQEKLDIQNEKTHYPYSAPLQMLDLMSDKAANIFQWEERFAARVAMYMADNRKMNANLALVQTIDIATPADLALKQQIEAAKTKEYASDEPTAFDIMQEINSYQEVSFKTAPKSVILSKFLEDGNFQPDENEVTDSRSIEELAKKSANPSQSLETETLAVVYEKQGKYDKAIEIYEKLMVRNPEKSSIFAGRIEELKNKKENK